MKYHLNRKKNVLGPHNIDILSVFFGSLLGDAFGETRLHKLRIVFQQEKKHQEYFHWLHFFFASKGYCNPEKPTLFTRIGKNNKIRYFFRCRTYSFGNLNWLVDLFYSTGKKVVPNKEFLDLFLTPLAIAVWVCDDGSRSGKGFKFCTNSFSKEEIQLLCDVLYRKYNIKGRPNRTGFFKKTGEIQYCLYIRQESMAVFIRLVKPFIVQSMYYKLGVS